MTKDEGRNSGDLMGRMEIGYRLKALGPESKELGIGKLVKKSTQGLEINQF